jgi:Family of unknown function (DUF5706)
MDKIEFLQRQLTQTVEWYSRCEEKAKFLVTIDTVVVSVASSLIFVGADDAASTDALLDGPVGLLLLSLGLSIALSFGCILIVLWARHDARRSDLPEGRGLLFFGDVAALSRDEHAEAVASLTEASFPTHVEAMLVSQSHILSRSVLRKHRALNGTIAFTMSAVMLLLALGVAYAASLPLMAAVGP